MKLRHGEVRMSADAIVSLLSVRHSEDVFVSECKDGPSQGSGHLRMDAWAMRKSWNNPTTYGYEVKISRSDFVGDDKWNLYLPLCSDFYFVCPSGLIQPGELGPEAGLIYVSATGTKLFLKKKAQRRDVKIPEDLFRYVLMCRAKITREYDRPVARDQWKDWLKEKINQ